MFVEPGMEVCLDQVVPSADWFRRLIVRLYTNIPVLHVSESCHCANQRAGCASPPPVVNRRHAWGGTHQRVL